VSEEELEYFWDFGDGSPVEMEKASGVSVKTHIYDLEGTYTAKLTIRSQDGEQYDTDTADIKIGVESIIPIEPDCQTIGFVKGWNYVTLEVIPPNSAIKTLLGDLDYEIAWHELGSSNYEFFLHHDNIDVGDFDTFEAGESYWIFSNENKQVTICGLADGEEFVTRCEVGVN
jgi:PKD repeat protein